ncbi:MAG: PEP-CTERM sorting domain-containing protein [Pirellulales bacterium]|nr:PEP-CTERM sorting domain-containing protein [Pirellulales bacterium]
MYRKLALFLTAVALAAFLSATASAGWITAASETGSGLDPAGIYYTGQTFDHPNLGAGYTVPSMDEDVAFFTDRTHQYNGVTAEASIASLGFVGADYVMTANDNRGVADYQMTVSVNDTVNAYVMMDARVTQPSWLPDNGWTNVQGRMMGIDENGDGTGPGNSIENQFKIWKKTGIAAGDIVLGERGGTGNNMYGVIITDPSVDLEAPIYDTQPVHFTWDTATGTGMIEGDLYLPSNHEVPIHFSAPMPAPAIYDPNPDLTPAGSLGTQTVPSGDHNNTGTVVGLDWSGQGPVTLTGTDGTTEYTVAVDLLFGPSGDSGYDNPEEDPLSSFDAELGYSYVYSADVTASDNALVENGGDAVGDPRFALYLAVGEENPNGRSHRLTQDRVTFAEGADAYSRSVSNQFSKYAAYAPLSFYYGVRDDANQLGGGSVQLDSMFVEGYLAVDTTTIVPEPCTMAMLIASGLLGLILWRRRRAA